MGSDLIWGGNINSKYRSGMSRKPSKQVNMIIGGIGMVVGRVKINWKSCFKGTYIVQKGEKREGKIMGA